VISGFVMLSYHLLTSETSTVISSGRIHEIFNDPEHMLKVGIADCTPMQY
jgi:hypothetical protein